MPPLFQLVARAGDRRSTTHELHRTLNMGIGMVVVVRTPTDADDVQAAIAEETWVIGELVAGQPASRTVHLV